MTKKLVARRATNSEKLVARKVSRICDRATAKVKPLVLCDAYAQFLSMVR